MSDTPITDAEEARQIAEYEKSRECGDPPFAADFEFARKMERQLAVAKVLLRHALHGAKFVPDDNGGHIEFAGKCFRV